MKFTGYIFLLIFVAFQARTLFSVISCKEAIECCKHTSSSGEANTHDTNKNCDESCKHFHACNCICICFINSSLYKFTNTERSVKYYFKKSDVAFQYSVDFWHPPKIS